jgi:outer membrane protein
MRSINFNRIINNKIFQFINLISISFTISITHAQSFEKPIVLTLDKAITLATQQNRDILMAAKDRSKAEAQVGEAWAGALPQLSLSGQYVRNIKKPVLFIPPNSPINPTDETAAFEIGSSNAYQMGLSLSQPLFSRRVGLALKIAKSYRDFIEQSCNATKQSVIRDVKKAFYFALLAQKLVETNRQGYDVVKANYENVKLQYKNGTAAEFDLLRAEVQLANTEPLLISAENNLALAVNALKNLLALPLDQEVDLQGDFTFEEISQITLEENSKNAVEINPMIRQLVFQESMLDKNIGIERASHFPTLNLFSGYNWQAQDNTYNFNNYMWAKTLNVGVSLSMPLFDGFKTSERVQQAILDKQKMHFLRLKAEEGLNIQIQAAELKMAEAKKRITGQEKTIGQAEKAVHIAQTRYQNGVGTQLELLDAQVAMTRAQTNYAQAIYDYLVAKADWEYAVGTSSNK